MRPTKLKTKIFLDGGDPEQTKYLLRTLSFLDGQTTNPTLISKNPKVIERLASGKKFTEGEIYEVYKQVVGELSGLMPTGSVSIEVYSDETTSSEEMLAQSEKMYAWIPNAHIKFPSTANGLIAAEEAIKKNMRVNMTLCFTQQQAAGVYAATLGASVGQVFVSPFVGRLDDIGQNGMDLIKNILKMYQDGDQHVQVLTASVRSMEHFLYALYLGSDIITAPFNILKDWGENGMRIPESFVYQPNLEAIPYSVINLNQNWREFNLSSDLTQKGILKFSDDWNNLILTKKDNLLQ